VSAHAATTEFPRVELPREQAESQSPPLSRAPRAGATAAATLAVAGVLCFATFLAGGGLNLAPMTTLELTLTLAAGAIVAGAIVLVRVDKRARGLWSVCLLLAFTALTGLSVVWSVAPDASWQDAGRMLAYSGVFAAAVALAWMAPGGWRALLGGIVLAAVVVCGYALLTKVLPNQLGVSVEANFYARLQEPYGYWNAIGLTAAMGAIGCLWLAARRAGHALLSALAYPAMGLMIVTLMLAYSRGALAALVIGVAVWMCIVPLRLRGARVLIVGGLGAAPIVAWDFSRHALSNDGVALATRTTAGHQLGVLLGAMLVVLALAGIAIGFFGDRRAPTGATRRAAGIGLAALLILLVLGLAGGLAASKRGFTGTISHDLSSLTNPNAPVPKNTPGRLTAVGSVRARYWNEALEIFKAHPALGAGAAGYETARLRYRTQPLDVRQAHGYVVQTLADLGIVGLAITLALLFAWMGAAGRPTHPFNHRWMAQRRAGGHFVLGWRRAPLAYTPERIGMLTMLCIVVVFGVHSFADWTWYVPGDALVALLCAGWLAGRGTLPAGNLAEPAGSPAAAVAVSKTNPMRPRMPSARELGPVRVGIAIAVVAGALLAAWTEWQPQRSVDASESALVLLPHDPVAARAAAQAGVERDPLSAQALFTLSAVEHATGESALARATLQKAVRLQPSNPQTWLTLGQYDMTSNPRQAVSELRAAVYLDPESIATQNAYVEALRATGTATSTTRAASTGTSAIVAHGRKRRQLASDAVRTNRRTSAESRAGRRLASPESRALRRLARVQKRLRRALASSTRRAPGSPPARATAISSKPKSASNSTSSPGV
jgi:cytochrome c-type biogenesis protein CcmH/NrfG